MSSPLVPTPGHPSLPSVATFHTRKVEISPFMLREGVAELGQYHAPSRPASIVIGTVQLGQVMVSWNALLTLRRISLSAVEYVTLRKYQVRSSGCHVNV